MVTNPTLFSTKKLTASQQELVLNTGIGLVHYDILKTTARSFDPLHIDTKALVITSKNAIPALKKIKQQPGQLYVVGHITGELLKAEGFAVTIVATNARELAAYIISQNEQASLTYLCGSHRRQELPELLADHKIELKEVIVYDSIIVNKSFDRIFAAGLFYSPRGVYAFAKANQNQPQCAVCIGETTARAAREVFSRVVVAQKQTVENVLVTAIKELRND